MWSLGRKDFWNLVIIGWRSFQEFVYILSGNRGLVAMALVVVSSSPPLNPIKDGGIWQAYVRQLAENLSILPYLDGILG